MTDRVLIVAEARARELLDALHAAVTGRARWRLHAAELLRSIARYELPEYATQALREVDARKRAAEQMQDLVNG